MAQIHRRRGTRTVLGPVLYFRGVQGERWRISAVFARDGKDEPADLAVDGVRLPVPPRYMVHQGDTHLWRFDFAVPRGDETHRIGYGFPEGERWYFAVPGRAEPLRLAYVAGAAPSSNATGTASPNPSPWSHLMSRHRAEPFHLLLQGGGQTDGRGVWTGGPHMAGWSGRPARDRQDQPFTAAMAEETAAFFIDLYSRQWRQPERAALHASLPSVMAPGGLDYGEDDTAAPRDNANLAVARGVRAEARRWAALFQLASPAAPSFEQCFRIGDIGLLTLDLQTGPDGAPMLAAEAWEALPAWLGQLDGVRHLLVLSGSALVVPVRRGLGSLTALLPGALRTGEEPGFEWRRQAHEAEWLRLVRILGDFAHRSRARVTILSGAPGVAAHAALRGPDYEIGQLACPPLAQPPAGKPVCEIFERAARRPESVRDGLTLAVEPIPEAGRAAVAEQGWLALLFTLSGDMVAEWQIDGRPTPLCHRVAAVKPTAL